MDLDDQLLWSVAGSDGTGFWSPPRTVLPPSPPGDKNPIWTLSMDTATPVAYEGHVYRQDECLL